MIYSVRLICTTAISLGPFCMLFTTLHWLLSLSVGQSRQPVALKWDRGSLGLVYFLGKYLFSGLIMFFLIEKYLFQIKWNKMISKYKKKQYTFYWLMCIWIVGGRVPKTGMLAGMNLSKPGMNLAKPGMNLSKPGKKHNNHVIITHNAMVYKYSFHTLFQWRFSLNYCTGE